MPEFYPKFTGFKSRARAYRATTDQVIANNTLTQVQLNAETYDTQNEFDPTTNYRFTATKAGYYQVNATVTWVTTVDQSRHWILLFKDSIQITAQVVSSSGITALSQSLSDAIYLAAGQVLDLRVIQITGGSASLYADEDYTFMSIHKLSE